MPHTALRYAQSHYFYPLFLSRKLSCNFSDHCSPLLFKCFLCRHLWQGTLSLAKTVLKYFTWHSHTQRKFHLRVGYDYRHRDSLKTDLYYKITIKYCKLNTKHLKSFFATSHAKFYQSTTQAQNFYRDKKVSSIFIHYIQYYIQYYI